MPNRAASCWAAACAPAGKKIVVSGTSRLPLKLPITATSQPAARNCPAARWASPLIRESLSTSRDGAGAAPWPFTADCGAELAGVGVGDVDVVGLVEKVPVDAAGRGEEEPEEAAELTGGGAE